MNYFSLKELILPVNCTLFPEEYPENGKRFSNTAFPLEKFSIRLALLYFHIH
jgi:hypothetical protein